MNMKDNYDDMKKVREATGVPIDEIKRKFKIFPKATVDDMIDILNYETEAIKHRKSVVEMFIQFTKEDEGDSNE